MGHPVDFRKPAGFGQNKEKKSENQLINEKKITIIYDTPCKLSKIGCFWHKKGGENQLVFKIKVPLFIGHPVENGILDCRGWCSSDSRGWLSSDIRGWHSSDSRGSDG